MHFHAFLLAAAAAAAAIPLAEVDVAIIGAGLSGLSAAKDLAAAGKSFAVLEARDRVGGRVLNVELPGGIVEEVGAEFVGPTQDRVLALATELGLSTYPTYNTGNCTLLRNGTVTNYPCDLGSGGLPPVSTEALIELVTLQQRFNTLAAELDVRAPWNHPNASMWDSITLGTFIASQLSLSDAKFLIDTAITGILSTETNEPSLLYMLAYIAASGNETTPGTLDRLIGVTGGAQERRILGGTQLIALRLAEKLGGENIHLNSPVRRIQRHKGRYTVISDRRQLTANKVIVAMSPPLAARIAYDPPLSPGRDHLTQRMPMGSIGKAIAIYPTPWWREMGLNAQALADTGIIRITYDNTPVDGSFGAIMGFIVADEMRRLDKLNQSEIEGLVTQSLVDMFGTEAARPTQVIVHRWDLEVYSRGGPVAYAPPGVLTDYGASLREPVGGIYFAGTETSFYWVGYMDGAVRGGEWVAAEVLQQYTTSQ
ncbi:flavin monoamine oxidase family protein [Aspergillus ibericus CBS 121593]|uniref:Amine oxidase n=1 Tax=Aspergillus ibericus CBS 121593 TaxID=1448316 RepID=A0A395HE08_9EURO|nr:monoamine oxidase [Aspergillus ibericus CBS 121593]RAL06201.1 monoamine oxidase [Aspergillus ibericus CBS 121593]